MASKQLVAVYSFVDGIYLPCS